MLTFNWIGYFTGRLPLALGAGPFVPGAGPCGLVEVSTGRLWDPWPFSASMRDVPIGDARIGGPLTRLEALGCLPQPVFDVDKASLALSGGQLADAEGQHCKCGCSDVIAGVKFESDTAALNIGHAAAPSEWATVLIGAVRCRCTPPSLKRMPSASSAVITRSSALALALGMLPLEPSHVVRLGREIAARSATSCCDSPARLRAARSIPPVIRTIVMLGIFARRQRAAMSAYFTNSLTPPTGLGLLASPSRRVSSGRAARGSAQRKVACRPA